MNNSLNENVNQTLVNILQQRALNESNKKCFSFLGDGINETEFLTYRELDRQARQIAAYLQKSYRVENREN